MNRARKLFLALRAAAQAQDDVPSLAIYSREAVGRHIISYGFYELGHLHSHDKCRAIDISENISNLAKKH